MNRFFSRSLVVMVTLGFLFVLSSCAFESDETIAAGGTWELAGTYGSERWVITDTSITYSSDYGSGFSTVYSANIVSFSNDGLNAGDITLTTGGDDPFDPGFAVIQYTYVNNAGTGEAGKYNVFRWADNAADRDTRDFTQGYKDATGSGDTDYTNDVFDTAGAAESGATNAAGYFAYASTGAVRQ